MLRAPPRALLPLHAVTRAGSRDALPPYRFKRVYTLFACRRQSGMVRCRDGALREKAAKIRCCCVFTAALQRWRRRGCCALCAALRAAPDRRHFTPGAPARFAGVDIYDSRRRLLRCAQSVIRCIEMSSQFHARAAIRSFLRRRFFENISHVFLHA